MLQSIASLVGNWWPGLLVFVIALVCVIALFRRWNIDGLKSHPNPVKSYADAVQRIQAIQATETHLKLACRAKFMTHAEKTDRVIVFVHGYTNSPQQFADLGKRFHDLGYNVLILRAPHHGLEDRMTDEQGHITAEELAVYADQVVDIVTGLGKFVVMAGISMGGVITGWAAQNRSEIDLAVIISPGFSFKKIPVWLTVPVSNIFRALPISYAWWDKTLKEKAGPSYAYPRYSRRTLGEMMRLGLAMRAKAQQTAPAARSILMVTNANDRAVSNEVARQIVRLWQKKSANFATYEFEASLGLGHDIIDPNNSEGNIEVVYARLIELIDKK